MAHITNSVSNMLERFKTKQGRGMKVLSIVVKCDKVTLRRLKERGVFSDDPQWFFNMHMVFASARDMVFRASYFDLISVEQFLASEDIPYTRTLDPGAKND